MTEPELLRAAAARDPRALETLYRAHFGPLQRRALAITGCPQDAADAAQDALLRTFDRLPALDPHSLHFGAYATTVARHEALARRRRPVTVTEPPDPAEDLHACAERAELRQRVRGAIRALPERQRRALFHAEYEQRPRAEVAAALGLSENAAGQLLYRARRALQSSLADS
jgi:RNA polymerase sigma-70 factor (ECF subfamily)